ncbi:TPA: protein RcpB [Pasteurella multocida]|uniref:Protein RcpB n=2 Tax=Pasteurella multocida TaxID=747 RepID=A0A849CIK7_PASMD|nr:protein RcpB [Pasteurella multocida]AFI45552.1 RcpB [Pasteurella multocida subsp. multocida str. 3480]AWW54045.1 protein RcpB [Pasteurella multocida]EPE71925.1 protein RcpB [Pasteurella multocida 671/90]MCH1906009.1 protein RcpB [Pasteurella multocida]MCL7793816.1 protein RcpB [Pasteurella multocida]
MRKLVTSIVFVTLMYSAQGVAFSKNELVTNTNVAQPVQLDGFSRTQLVNRYVVSEYSDVVYHNVLYSVLRDVGSDMNKRVHIIWSNKESEKKATGMRKFLINKGVEAASIKLVRSEYKKALYPLYVEVSRIGTKRANCRIDTAEDMMSWDGLNPCATKSNQRIQLKY